jgi:lipid A 3-O-deacylase
MQCAGSATEMLRPRRWRSIHRMDASQRAALETERKTRMKMNVRVRLGLMAAVMRWLLTTLLALLAAASQIVAAEEPAPSPQVFAQVGVAEDAQTAVIGFTQPWSWQRELASGRLGGYWEATFGRWSSELEDGRSSNAWVTQLGATPVLRWQPRAWGERGFVEGGIGANLLLPVYRSRDKRFSTAFNFGSHVAVGWRFGTRWQHELALRLQHFSNAGIRRPNPGEDFVQLRWAWRPR